MESPSAIPMSVVKYGHHIAFAAFNQLANQIILENCVVSSDSNIYEIAERVTAAVKPSLLLLSSCICGNASWLETLTKAPNVFDENVDPHSDAPPPTAPSAQGSIPYRLLKSSSFDVRKCKETILKLEVATLVHSKGVAQGSLDQPHRRFPTQNGQLFKVSSFHSLASVIDFDCTAEIQALGALLSFLQSVLFPQERNCHIRVNDIVRANASSYMAISDDTVSALHIFATERHPLVASKGSGNSKEGFSLFSFLDRTRSRAGRSLLREWMQKPLTDVSAISARQDGIELFILPEMHTTAVTISTLMERIASVDGIILRIQKCTNQFQDFLSLSKSLSSATAIVDTIQEEIMWKLRQRYVFSHSSSEMESNPMESELGKFEELGVAAIHFVSQLLERCNAEALQNLFERITSVIDEEATSLHKMIVIRMGHNTQLDLMKQHFSQLQETLSATGKNIIQRLPHLDSLLQVIFLPQVGFLVAIKDHISLNEQGILSDDFSFVCSEAGSVYFKNEDVRVLDESIGDLDAYIKDIEALILTDLEEDILDCENELRCTFTALAELDCILALAECALDFKYVRPEVLPATEKIIQIWNGRHPLQEIVLDSSFIPNNTCIDPTNRVQVLTGPNFSGKSCYARQVGILTFMAQIGSFIPCEAARISVVDQILARFSSVETCSVPQSSFQLELSQMGTLLRRATPSTLVVIDEFGKGTSPASGISLLAAALQRLSNIKCSVLCTTHFLEIFSMELVRDGEHGIKALRMSVQIPQTLEENARPLFKLEDGVSSSSAGLACAKMAGVKEAVIKRAHEIVLAVKGGRKVQPLVEILRGHLDLSDIEKEILGQFIKSDWKAERQEDINHFLSKVVTM
jgi:DNA mismatch repair protein MSH5